MFTRKAPRLGASFLGCAALIFFLGGCSQISTPTVISTSPANGATGVPVNTEITATFSEAMDPTTINATTFIVRQGTTPVLGTVTYTGVTATFTPNTPLAANTLYTATATTGATALDKGQDITNQDRAFMALLLGLFLVGQAVNSQADGSLASDHVWTFTTGPLVETVAPTVSFTDPADDATGVPVNKKIAATFSEGMDPATITAATFTLHQGATLVAGTVTYIDVTATFSPTVALATNTLYTATITTGAEDLAGNALATNYVWTFTTGAVADFTAPTVSSTDPADTEIGVPVNKKIAATFSEAMDPLTITAATFTLRRGAIPVAGTVTYAGVTGTFTPTTALATNTEYTATITTGAEDLAGNALAVNYVWTFTTGAAADITAPAVSSTDPANGAIGVPVNMRIAATFSEAMDPLTITTVTFTLRQGMTPVLGTVIYAGVTATFTPIGGLQANTLYTATITTGAKDLAGNALATSHVWTFTTGAVVDLTTPTVSVTDPRDNVVGVPVNKKIVATFSKAMDPLTITTVTFTLHRGLTPVSGTVTYSGVTAIFTPTGGLVTNTTYTATITTGAMDVAGNALAIDHVWSFSTGDAADVTAPSVSSVNPTNGAVAVPLNRKISATFDEVMDPLTITTTTFTLYQGLTNITGTVSYVGNTATFTPTVPLAITTLYTATIKTGAKDVAGNALALDYVWSFTTGAAADVLAPTIITTDPVNTATGVPINKKIAVTFSETMDPLTITTATFTLYQGLTNITGTVSCVGAIATFTPFAPLLVDTGYTATITTGAKDMAGLPLAANHVWTFTTGATMAQGSINLGTANSFAILAGSTVENTGPTVIDGDLGVSPGTAVTNFPPGTIINGAIFTGVASAAGQAKLDLTNAFNEAAGRSLGAVSLPGDLSGLTLYPGLYKNSTSVMLSAGNVTLDAQGDANAVFLFQMGSTLTTLSGTQVILSGSAKAANVYWQVGTSATLGTNSIFKGNILAGASITLTTGAALEGRALTQIAAVTLDDNDVTVPAP